MARAERTIKPLAYGEQNRATVQDRTQSDYALADFQRVFCYGARSRVPHQPELFQFGRGPMSVANALGLGRGGCGLGLHGTIVTAAAVTDCDASDGRLVKARLPMPFESASVATAATAAHELRLGRNVVCTVRRYRTPSRLEIRILRSN